jgi:hypothetical protein
MPTTNSKTAEPWNVEATKGPSRRRFARSGFTVAESMMASVILGIAVAGLGVALAASHQNAQVAEERGAMIQAARALMEDVASIPFLPPALVDKPGWDLGVKTRADYDDVFDFDGYTDLIPLIDRSTVITDITPGTAGYTRTVVVQPRSDPATPTASKSGASFARVTVTVTAPSGDKITLPYLAARTVWRR